MLNFIKLAGERIKSTLEETIDKIGDKKDEIKEAINTTAEKVVTSLRTGREKALNTISNIADKIKEKIEDNKENKENQENQENNNFNELYEFNDFDFNGKDDEEEEDEEDEKKEIKSKMELKTKKEEYEKEKYEAIGNNTIFTSDENWGICPITQCYMENPVLTPSGIYYEKEAILDWIKKCPNDPFTREYLTSDMLMEDAEYKKAIREYRKIHNV